MDALTQVIHRSEVLAPVLVEHAEHDVLLDVPHDRRADALHFLVVEIRHRGDDLQAHGRVVERFRALRRGLDVRR